MTNKCKRCGKNILRQFEYCYECYNIVAQQKRDQFEREMQDMDEEPSEVEDPCVMCGREWGTSVRKDGKSYCTMCWTIWNS